MCISVFLLDVTAAFSSSSIVNFESRVQQTDSVFRHYYSSNQYEDAIYFLNERLIDSALGDNIASQNFKKQNYTRLAFCYNRLGLPLLSIENCSRALTYCSSVNESDSFKLSFIYPQLATCYSQIYDYSTASNYFSKAFEYFDSHASQEKATIQLLNILSILIIEENLTLGDSLLTHVAEYDINSFSTSTRFQYFLTLAQFYYKVGNLHLCEHYLNCLNQFDLAELPLDWIAERNETQANLYNSVDRIYEADSLHQNAIRHLSEQLGATNRKTNKALLAYVDFLLNQNRAKEALVLLSQQLILYGYAKPYDLLDIQSIALLNIYIQLLYKQEQITAPTLTVNLCKLMLRIKQFLSENIRDDKFKYQLGNYQRNAITIALKISAKNDYSREAFEIIAIAKQNALFDAIHESSNNEAGDQLYLKMRELNLLISFYYNKKYEALQVGNSLGAFKASSMIDRLLDQVDELKLLRKYDKDKMADFHIDINNETVVVMYYQSHSTLYCSYKQGHNYGLSLIEVNREFISKINLVISGLSFENRFNFDGLEAAKLYESIWPKNLGNLDGDDVVVLPDSICLNLPFECLLDNEMKYLVEKCNIRYGYTLHDAQILHLPPIRKAAFFGGDFSNDENLSLSLFSKEKKIVSKFFTLTDFSESKAQRNDLLNLNGNYPLVHLASHAGWNDNLNQTCLLFSNERIYTSEINYSSVKANLVYLSACETAIGEVVRGEGYMSLSRAFIYSGVKAVLTTLWSINESSNFMLMEQFYQNLANGHDASQSISIAKRTYLTNEKIAAPYKLPYYWAGQVLYGENVVFEEKTNKLLNTLLTIIGTILVSALAGIYFRWKILKH